MTKVVVYGAGGHAKVVADIVVARDDMELLGFVDDGREPADNAVLGKPILGDGAWLREHNHPDVQVALGVGNNHARRAIAQRCAEAGIGIVTAVHPSATVSRFAKLGPGTVVMAGTVVNPDAVIGAGAIVNTASIADHDVMMGDYAHLAPNAALGGAVRIGNLAFIGIGASVIQLVVIGANTTVGAGAVVPRDLPADVVAVGVPAKVIRHKAP